ncbi:hypothetical protein M409DRAFT_28800 [Zasmidium cellare ATCC 36951]|uniref:Amino acid permease/ SLC12A domain-containing protein n=1 Tax=Zasmidium cellare ATCC 36951 TaxID=1080233 RepID=A0A6A6C2Z9_ZASCE|nr:uncharacterized protein M409DRAFT_28800 [Zasmidium cellare ATCC 36951]KAF2160658.1 hypothetical protein M409DRAFT_28800 [Zasmidium cellare ATCC 36951]
MDLEEETASTLKRKPTLQSLHDATSLAELGHVEALTRKFGLWSMLALAFCVLGTWSTFAQGLASGLQNGGPISILWGLCLVFACNICVALSLGELTSAMPTALGQAYWVHRLVDTPTGRFASYMCAWINTFGWWTLTASQIGFMTNFLLGMKRMFEPEWAGADEGWVQFLVYLGITMLFTVANLVACRRDKILPWFNGFVGVWFVGLFFVFILALVICVGTKRGLTYQPASFVFGEWIRGPDVSWPDGVVWFTGLVQAAYGLTAFDSVIHMIEEIPAPRRNGPRVIWLAVVCGAVTGFIFMVMCLFCIQDLEGLLNADLPFIELVQQTVGLEGGAALIALFEFNGLGQGVSIATTASRLTWGFARDGGLPWSRYFSHVDPTWKVPARALWLQGFLIALVGILYLFANTVLQAILSVSTIALTVSYGMPIVTLLIAGRDKLPRGGQFQLGRLGPVINWVSVVYCAVTTVFFFFPSGPNPSPADMNYAIAVFGVMLVIAVGFWFTNGRKTFLQTDDSAMRLELARRLELDTHEVLTK